MPVTDLYFEASGAKGLLSDIANMANMGSRIVTVAMQWGPVALEGSVLMAKELTLMGSIGYPTEFPEVMALLAQRTVNAEDMISHRYPFTDFLEAFDTATDPSLAAKVLVTFE